MKRLLEPPGPASDRLLDLLRLDVSEEARGVDLGSCLVQRVDLRLVEDLRPPGVSWRSPLLRPEAGVVRLPVLHELGDDGLGLVERLRDPCQVDLDLEVHVAEGADGGAPVGEGDGGVLRREGAVVVDRLGPRCRQQEAEDDQLDDVGGGDGPADVLPSGGGECWGLLGSVVAARAAVGKLLPGRRRAGVDVEDVIHARRLKRERCLLSRLLVKTDLFWLGVSLKYPPRLISVIHLGMSGANFFR